VVWIPAIVIGYLLGSIPAGVLIGRAAGGDPRKGGSGNIGATNVTRTLGKKWGALTLLADAFKGALPTWLALRYAPVGDDRLALAAAVAFAAVIGHCYPVWLRFRGGKGVATAFGVMLVFSPVAVALAALAWIAVFVFTRVPALGSLTAAALFIVIPAIEHRPFPVHVLAVAVGAVMVVRHVSNLRGYARKRREKARRRRGVYRSRV
jgi:glycerol-3-phosphate acyltransferase PlsY